MATALFTSLLNVSADFKTWVLTLLISADMYIQRGWFSISAYSCAFKGDILLQGMMYVSQNWICFYSKIRARGRLVSPLKLHFLFPLPCSSVVTETQSGRVSYSLHLFSSWPNSGLKECDRAVFADKNFQDECGLVYLVLHIAIPGLKQAVLGSALDYSLAQFVFCCICIYI